MPLLLGRRLLAFALLAFALLTAACDPPKKEEKPPIEFDDGPLSGTVNGLAWTVRAASSDAFLDDEDGFFAVFTDEETDDVCGSFSDGGTVLTKVPRELGEFRLGFSRNATFSYTDDEGVSQNDVATSGGIRVDEIDEGAGVVRGALKASKDDHEVNGTFELTICTE